MSIRVLVYTVLSSDSSVSARVGTRIYPALLPQNPTLPAITYQRISNSAQNGTTALRESRYQFNCWAGTYDDADDLANDVKTALEEHTDTDQTPGIKMAEVVNQIDDYDEEADIYRSIVDVVFDTTGD